MSTLPIDLIRALLYVAARPLTEKEMALYTGLPLSEIELGLRELDFWLEQNDRVLFLQKVHSGWQLCLQKSFLPAAERMMQEKPLKISKACLEVLALIAYHQPITRSEIEKTRGVSLSPNVLKQLFEWEWIEVCGHKDVPGRPELLRTTKRFLDEYGLKQITDLPQPNTLLEIDNSF